MIRVYIFAKNYAEGRRFADQYKISDGPGVNILTTDRDLETLQGIEAPICILLDGWWHGFKISYDHVKGFIRSRRGIILRSE